MLKTGYCIGTQPRDLSFERQRGHYNVSLLFVKPPMRQKEMTKYAWYLNNMYISIIIL